MYLCVYILIVLTLLSKGLRLEFNMGVNSGLEIISMITLFVFGLTSFKDNFKFFSVNGFSRKTQFLSTTAFFGILSCIFALIDTVNGLFLTSVTDYRSLFMELYAPLVPASGSMGTVLPLLLENFLLLTVFYFCITMVGLFITTLYYRMNKGLKIAISVGVPVVLIYGVEPLNDYVFHGRVYEFFANVFSAVWGIYGGCNPLIAVGSQLLFAVLFAALAYLLARRAVIKK
jgi:hypothetical protein